jgi:hypothetical protein
MKKTAITESATLFAVKKLAGTFTKNKPPLVIIYFF